MSSQANTGFTCEETKIKSIAISVPDIVKKKEISPYDSNNNRLKLAVVLVFILVVAVVVVAVFYAKEVRDNDKNAAKPPSSCLDDECVRSAAGKQIRRRCQAN